MTLSTWFQRSCEDWWFMFCRDISDIWHAVKELFKRDDKEVRSMQLPCYSCKHKRLPLTTMPCLVCSPQHDQWEPPMTGEVTADPEELLP